MTETAQPLNPLKVPLWGSRLIEASAGTGKTWTLAALVLRFVLGHGDEATGFGQPLSPSQVLVMTFTRAATRELSERIRARLASAARCLRGEVQPDPDDSLLLGLLADYPAGPAREAAAWRAAMAADAMDAAAVHTIDAWCQRMLREHAFDSGNLFDESLQPDERAITAEAARDYWRQQILPLPVAVLSVVSALWPSVERLVADVQALLPYVNAGDAPSRAPAPTLATLCVELLAARSDALAQIKMGWADRLAALRDWFAHTLSLEPCPFNRTKLQPRRVQTWFDDFDAWATTPELDAPKLSDKAWLRLTVAGIDEARGTKVALVIPDVISQHLQACAGLQALLQTVPPLVPALRRHAAERVAARVQALKAAAGTYGYADLLQRLDTALHGPRGAALRERIVAQYPVVLIDEFQDTSPLQYRIFERLYRTAANARETALFLVGDAKQSIYGFRGADIQSYLRARRATEGRHLMLATNYRSTTALVAVVNHLFEQAEQRPGSGAFAFRKAGHDPLPFVPVQARGRAEVFVVGASEALALASTAVPAFTLSHDPVLHTSDELRALYAARCAEHIVGLLNDASAGFATEDGGFSALQPADIAVLVRTGTEASAVRLALRQRRVASVYLSDRDSVFAGAEAADLLLWLRAVADPLNGRLVRAALATRTVGLSLPELQRLAVDEQAFDERVAWMAELNAIWHRQGVLAMLRQSLHRLALPARWLAEPEGERRLTNVLQLAELLQAASTRVDGEQALLRWLAEQCAEAAAGIVDGDDKLVRLESDAGLVQVVTVHKSKGLEYPVVCLPFATTFIAASASRSGFVLQREAGGARVPVFDPDAAAIAAAEQERLQEDLRLLYVALTRAQHALWLGVAGLKIGHNAQCLFHRSALGHLLAAGHEIEATQIGELLTFGFGKLPQVRLESPQNQPLCTRLRERVKPLPLSAPHAYHARFDRRWSIGSFSALVASLSRDPAAGQQLPAEPVVQQELLSAPVDEVLLSRPHAVAAAAPWHGFPRGALAGNFLHSQLQWLAEEGFASPDEPQRALRLRRRCESQGYGGALVDDVQSWLSALLATPLPPLGATLPQLQTTRAELEFWMPADDLPAVRIDALCREHLLPGLPRPPLPERSLHGMVMGFADLVFEHAGRFWVLDYKSNALGADDTDYAAPALAAAVAAHRYEVQAALYLLALHRLLRQRLGAAYVPEQHIGGAIVWFLRGIRGSAQGACLLPPSVPLLLALDTALAGTAA